MLRRIAGFWVLSRLTLAICALTVVVVATVAWPSIPHGGLPAPGDLAFVATSQQLADGLYVTVPNLAQKPATVAVVPFGPFTADTPSRAGIGPAEVSSFRLTYQPGHRAAVSGYQDEL